MLITIMAMPARGIPWFTVTNSYIQQLDEDSYRLRAFVDWSDISFPYGIPDLGVDGPAYFNSFSMSLLGTSQYNATVHTADVFDPVNSPGLWSASHALSTPGTLRFLEVGFGYDFDVTMPFSRRSSRTNNNTPFWAWSCRSWVY